MVPQCELGQFQSDAWLSLLQYPERIVGEGTDNYSGETEILPDVGSTLSSCDGRIRQARLFACNLAATEKTKPRKSCAILADKHDNQG